MFSIARCGSVIFNSFGTFFRIFKFYYFNNLLESPKMPKCSRVPLADFVGYFGSDFWADCNPRGDYKYLCPIFVIKNRVFR